MECYLLGHVAADVNGTFNGPEVLEAVDGDELGVVGNLVLATDGRQFGERDVGERRVGDEGDATGLREVGRGEGLEEVVLEDQRSVHAGQRRQHDLAAVTEGHVQGRLQVGEAGDEALGVGLEGQRGGDVLELRLDTGQVRVVVDVEVLHHLQVNALERYKLSVGDQDVLGSADTRRKGQVLQRGQSLPLDGVDLAKLGEGETRQGGEVVKHKASADPGQAAGLDGVDAERAGAVQLAVDSLDASQGEVAIILRSDDDVSRDGSTVAAQGIGIALVLDLVGLLIATVLSWKRPNT